MAKQGQRMEKQGQIMEKQGQGMAEGTPEDVAGN